MVEIGSEAKIQDVRSIDHVLKTSDQLATVRNIHGIHLSGEVVGGTSGWLMQGKTPEGWETTVKVAKNPSEETGAHYEYNAQMLREASSRTLFVPLYFGHGVTEIPGHEGEQFPYISMEHIKGKTLKDVMATNDIQSSLDILKTVARGVDEMLPIISTDLKPANIMIREDSNRPVLIDFDIARREGEINGGENGKFGGTLIYAGPELVQGNKPLTRALNNWQLGAIAYEMLTHERFMNMEHQGAALYRYSSEEAFNEFLNMRLDEAGLPTATRKVFSRALAYNPEERFETASDFAIALEAAEREYIQSSRRRQEGHTITRPVTKMLGNFGSPGQTHETHDHRDSSGPRRGRYSPRHVQTPKHRKTGKHRVAG